MKMHNELAWGRNAVFEPPWQEGKLRNLIRRDAHMLEGRIPFTQALILSAKVPGYSSDVPGSSFALRWNLEVGTGGGVINYRIDAGGTQRLSLPAEQCGISLVAEAVSGFTFLAPDNPIEAGAFMADGTAESGGATYTVRFSAAANGTTLLSPPVGAVGFRVLGVPGGAQDAFTANTLYQTLSKETNAGPLEQYAGSMISPLRYMPFPFNPQANLLRVNNTGNGSIATAFIEWQIDL